MSGIFKIIDKVEGDKKLLSNFNPGILNLADLAQTIRIFFHANHSNLKALSEKFESIYKTNISGITSIFDDSGIECQILNPDDSNGWRSGKIRARVYFEFCPDEPEEILENDNKTELDISSLDELRDLTH